VHGPLQAALLVEFSAELAGGRPPRRFSFRGIRPLFDGADFFLKARRNHEEMTLWVENHGGETTMEAKASW
jgi:3-methylfumaryl-CoA hydratase